jgi:hypothetical protein
MTFVFSSSARRASSAVAIFRFALSSASRASLKSSFVGQSKGDAIACRNRTAGE